MGMLEVYDINGNLVFDSDRHRAITYVRTVYKGELKWYRGGNNSVTWYANLPEVNVFTHFSTHPFILVQNGKVRYFNMYDSTDNSPDVSSFNLYRY